MKIQIRGHIVTIPATMLFTKDTNGKLMLVREEPSRFYDNNKVRGYYKCFFILDGRIFTRNLFVTRERNEVFSNYSEAVNYTPSWM